MYCNPMQCVCVHQELGVTKLGHIKRIQQAINEMKKRTPLTDDKPT